eukprot:m.196695 g.196695  ORF g.196695 m.196695 type:complete len:162 (-) comp18697_c0_seq6:614-1099(-)
MGIKLAKARGCTVTAISRNTKKQELAKNSGADGFVVSTDPAAMATAAGTLDLILNTIPAGHKWSMYQPLLKKRGRHVMFGIHSGMGAAQYAAKVRSKCSIVPSVIGGIPNTQEVMDLCAREKIYPEIEVVPVQKLNEVYVSTITLDCTIFAWTVLLCTSPQ